MANIDHALHAPSSTFTLNTYLFPQISSTARTRDFCQRLSTFCMSSMSTLFILYVSCSRQWRKGRPRSPRGAGVIRPFGGARGRIQRGGVGRRGAPGAPTPPATPLAPPLALPAPSLVPGAPRGAPAEVSRGGAAILRYATAYHGACLMHRRASGMHLEV